MDFPFAAPPIRDLMVELLSSLETRLGSSLQPDCTLPPDVQQFQNPHGTAYASIHIRSGLPSSQLDFILRGWLHWMLPSDEALNITSLLAHLKPSTDAPHFQINLIQITPTSLVLILDLVPREDLILYPDYLKTYYEDTQLDRLRQRLETLPEAEVRPHVSPSLYIRSVFSPTAVLVGIETTDIGEVIREHVGPITKELLQFWIESCACSERSPSASTRYCLAQRDRIMKSKFIEVLGYSFPVLFGQEVADRVLDVLEGYFNM